MRPLLFTLGSLALAALPALAQSLAGGTLHGTITDTSGAPIGSVPIEISNPISGFLKHSATAKDGTFDFSNIPFNTYRLLISAPGFDVHAENISVRSVVPIQKAVQLSVAGNRSTVTVEADPQNLVENVSTASQTVDRLTLNELPSLTPGSGLNDAIAFTSPSVAADSNGFFHPLGDHAQVSYVIDGQPISDQRNKVFSTSIPENAIQSMELVSGSPGAEFGDKTSLVVNASTRSGLGQKSSGSLSFHYGSFGTVGEEATLGLGNAKWGNFLVLNSERSGRFLDSPEFRPRHDIGNTFTVFDRLDYQPNGSNAVHLDLLAARNWFQIPNTYDQPRQDQRQKVASFNVAPGVQHTVSAKTLLSVNAFYRRDQVNYYSSRNVFDDAPATLSQDRSLDNFGMHANLSHVSGMHNVKVGLQLSQTRLDERFALGFTDPSYNSPADPDFLPALLPYDLTRGGALFQFRGKATISQAAWFAQDTITIRNLTVNLGLRYDYYNGLTRKSGPEPRSSFSYLFKKTKTVLRGGFLHNLETPVNENLVASSATGSGGLANGLFGGTAQERAIQLGSRNQYDAGIQQNLGKWLLLDVSYFRKYTRNAYDFNALFSTPITFPIGWAQSKLDGVGARLSTPDIRGFRAYMTMGHANARFFGPETGGIVFNSDLAIGAYRQDHDQVYQQNLNLHYQPKKNGWWGDFTWRYDSGLVVGAVNNLSDALALTAAQQSAIGLYCGSARASLSNRIASCSSNDYGAERINILGPGQESDDHSPPRTKPRSIFHLSAGTENLFHVDRLRTTARFTVLNLTNSASLYNFLSPFSGTHFYTPRTFQMQLGWMF